MVDDYISHARSVLSSYQHRQLDAPGMRAAAVLILLYQMDGQEHVLFTVRTDTVEHHKGQISFPGGGRDDDDHDLSYTALRETWEEIGVHPDHIEIIGRIDDSITISNFLVAPYVGILKQAPYEFTPSAHEVALVLETPIRHLLDHTNKEADARHLADGRVAYMPAYIYNGHRIWGATARMLESFLNLLHPEHGYAGAAGTHTPAAGR